MALRINKKLDNVGKTVMLMPSRSTIAGKQPVSLSELTARLASGDIDHVWVLGDNPVYTSSDALQLGELLKKLEHVVYFAEFEDETAMSSSWVLGETESAGAVM